MGCGWISALVPWSSFSPPSSLNLVLAELFLSLCTPHSSLLCSIFCPSLPTFPPVMPLPWLSHALQWVVGSSWIWLDPVGAAPASPHGAPAVPAAAGAWASTLQTSYAQVISTTQHSNFQLFHCSLMALLVPEADKRKNLSEFSLSSTTKHWGHATLKDKCSLWPKQNCSQGRQGGTRLIQDTEKTLYQILWTTLSCQHVIKRNSSGKSDKQRVLGGLGKQKSRLICTHEYAKESPGVKNNYVR